MLPKQMYRFLILFLVCLCSLSCTKSCQKNTQKKAIAIDVAQPLESLDPRYTTSATASRLAKLIYAPLFEIDDVDISPKPFLAQSIQTSDERTFVITLKPNLFFHDGSPLTADDVVYTYNDLKTSDVASPFADKFDYVADIKVLNNNQVQFVLKQPYAPFVTDLCTIGIVSKKSCFKRSQQCRHEYNGSGPYVVTKWDNAKETLHLTPFTQWFEGPAKSELLFHVVREENTRMLDLIGKKTDLVDGDFSPTNAFELKKHPHLTMNETNGLGYAYLAINVRGPRIDDKQDSAQNKTRLALAQKNVRKAIAQAIDFDQIIEKLLLGTVDRVSGLIPNGHWAKDKDLKAPSFDPKASEFLLDEAGFKRLGPDNMRFKLVISTTSSRLRQNCAQLYADFLKRVGIDASIRVKDWGALYEDMKKGQFELFSAIWVPVTDPDLYYFVHHSHSIPEGDKVGGNRHGYKNEEVDRLIELGRTTLDLEKRTAIYHEIERKLLDDLPYIPLWNEHRIVVYNHERLRGFTPSATGSLLWLRNASVH